MAKKVNLDESQRLDITVRKGDSFSLIVNFKDSAGVALALTTLSYSWAMEVRTPQNSQRFSSMVLASPSNSAGFLNTPLLEDFTTDDSGNLVISAGHEAMKKVPQGVYVYDLQYKNTIANPPTFKTVLRGNFIVNPDVTSVSS